MTTGRSIIAVMLVAIGGGCSGSETPAAITTVVDQTTVEPITSAAPTTERVSEPTSTQEGTASSTTVASTTETSTGEPDTAAPGPTSPPAVVDVTTAEGQLTVGGELPADVDPLVVVPADFQIAIGSFTELSAGITGASATPLDELTSFYRSSLEEVTGNPVVVEEITGGILQITAIDDGGEATVVLSAGPAGSTSITLTVER